jgi:hypothetical protein
MNVFPPDWVLHRLPDEEPPTAYVRDDGTDWTYCPGRSRLARSAVGLPGLAATLVLERTPRPGESGIAALITQAFVSLDLELALDTSALRVLEQEAASPGRAVFARTATFRVRSATRSWETAATGTNPRAAVSLVLDRTDAGSFLAALRGEESGLRVECEIEYTVPGRPVAVRLTADWVDLYNHFAEFAEGRTEWSAGTLKAAFLSAVRGGVVGLQSEDAGAEDAAYRSFLRVAPTAFVKLSPGWDWTDEKNTFRLKDRVPVGLTLDLSERVCITRAERLFLSAPLEEVIGHTTDGGDLDRFVTLVGPDGGKLAGVPALYPSAAPRGVDRGVVVHRDGRVASVAVALPTPPVPLRPNPSLDAIRLRPSDRFHLALLPPPDRPRVDSPDDPVWPSHDVAGEFLYPPEYGVVRPSPGQPLAGAPFAFTFTGTPDRLTGATLRFTLRPAPGAAATAALAARNNPPNRSVAVEHLSVTLSLPFRDANGTIQREAIPGAVHETAGGVTATFELADPWSRVAYGALGVPGGRDEPARLIVGYEFDAMVKVLGGVLTPLATSKIALLPIRLGRDLERGASFDPSALTVHFPDGEVRLRAEPARGAGAALLTRPGGLSLANSTLVRPPLAVAPSVLDILRRPAFALQVMTREQPLDVVFPNIEYRGVYAWPGPTGLVTDGPREWDALRQTEYRIYEELVRFRHPAYRVFRALPNPNRFLLVATEYRITRVAPTDPTRAYDPAILVYSVLDPAGGTERVVFHAALEPDVPAFLQRRLAVALREYHPDPVFDDPLQAGGVPAIRWGAVAGSSIAVTAVPGGFRVAVTTDLAGALLVQQMLQRTGSLGTAAWTFPDGTAAESTLVLDLTRITGPRESGPVEVKASGATVLRLTNRIESPVNVMDVMDIALPPAADAVVPVNRTLAAGESVEVPMAAPHGTGATFLPVFDLPAVEAVRIEEIRAFVDDIRAGLTFVNLIAFANHDLRALDVTARLAGVSGESTVPLSEARPAATFEFVLPLTRYLASPMVEMRFTRTTAGGSVTSAWKSWDLRGKGAVVSVDWDLIQ